ncbi:hypothetical protein GCM10010521_31000 [Streptomyces rameus]|uniref:DUF2207 domain-containing protein n=1 Tax=Streptomyces rameus TaxID=68261 RepID=A0ABP6ND73_9ACTN
MILFLLLILVALVLGIIGFAVHSLFYLLVIGAVVLVVDLVFGVVRLRGRKHRIAR